MQRYECKYRIPERLAHRIRSALVGHVRPDSHAAGRPSNTYPISSLYLDTDGLALYRETVEGRRSRFKLRVRAYSDASTAPVFLEIKRRQDGVVQKRRCPVMRADLRALLVGDVAWLAQRPPGLAGMEFVDLVQRTSAVPRVVVRYDREAYVGTTDPEFRVTFDRRLRILPTDQIQLPVESRDFRPIPVRDVILELKFNDRCPPWIQELVRVFELRRTSFSKYCHAVDAKSALDGASLT